jgi:hypothetical protein
VQNSGAELDAMTLLRELMLADLERGLEIVRGDIRGRRGAHEGGSASRPCRVPIGYTPASQFCETKLMYQQGVLRGRGGSEER